MTDPTAVLHSHLASALSTLGDAQYWEESISPAEIRRSLQDADPSSPSSVPALLKAMKWLLASISKGRDVSDFYVQVVKLVSCLHSLEVRKMVYIYLVQYADHSPETRELSLLSINSFQRGLRDSEPWIRALALRVLTSVTLPDILAIQVLAVTQHAANDTSPYVRKCAAMAVSKLYPRCREPEQRAVLLELLQQLLDHDPTTMVLSSAIIAFSELISQDDLRMPASTATSASATSTVTNNDQLHLLHGSYRKLCHLLTDMDEWGQVVAVDLLTRYARRFFKQPRHHGPLGSAEQVDQERRVTRSATGVIASAPINATKPIEPTSGKNTISDNQKSSIVTNTSTSTNNVPHRRKVIKRRVVKKGFYSDEEDESTDEEIFADTLESASGPLAAQMRQPEFSEQINNNAAGDPNDTTAAPNGNISPEEADLDEDHRLLLHSALPLLKSRNSGVVLAVCALHYYAGVSSVPIFKAMGQALVRIQRSERRRPEIQYVVLASIRKLVTKSPSAFAPFLPDFFLLPDMDPPFTRWIKLDILTALALDPPSIQTVLQELKTYVTHATAIADGVDVALAVPAITAVGRVVELAQIVYQRQNRRPEADAIALNCLQGLWTLSLHLVESMDDHAGTTASIPHDGVVLGACVVTMQRILQMLLLSENRSSTLHDPKGVTGRALRRIVLLLVYTLSCLAEDGDGDDDVRHDLDDDEDEQESNELEAVARVLPPGATAAALWLMGEYLSSQSPNSFSSSTALDMDPEQLGMELLRLLIRCFLQLEPPEKEQAVHLASKLCVTVGTSSTSHHQSLCEQLMALGRLDVNPDVRDRARFESCLVHASVGLRHDTDGLDDIVVSLHDSKKNTIPEEAQRILRRNKPAASYLPLERNSTLTDSSTEHEEVDGQDFRFGTLSSLVGHRARSAYQPLPPWAAENSPSSLREPPVTRRQQQQPLADHNRLGPSASSTNGSGFYKDADENSSSSEDESTGSSSSSSSSGEGSRSSYSSSGSSSSDTDSEEEIGQEHGKGRTGVMLLGEQQSLPSQMLHQYASGDGPAAAPQAQTHGDGNLSSSTSSGSSSSSSSAPARPSDGNYLPSSTAVVENLIPMGTASVASCNDAAVRHTHLNSAMDDLKGLVLEPVVLLSAEPTDNNFDRDSSAWIQLMRPEHAKGLSIQARFLRGATKAQQAHLLGLMADKPTVVCLQVRCQNVKNGGSSGPIRHIRILQRSSASSGSMIAPRKVVLPPEISQILMGQHVECLIGFDFFSASDRDGSLHAKLEIKFDSSGTVPVDIRPSIGDLLLPCRQTVDQFDADLRRMHGFNRVESEFTLSCSREALTQKLLARVALSFVGVSSSWDGDKLRLAGTLPASSDPVYVLVTCAADTAGQCKVVVCCDHALVVNSIMNLLKRSLAE